MGITRWDENSHDWETTALLEEIDGFDFDI